MKRSREQCEEPPVPFKSAEEAKASGNQCFKRGMWQKAVDNYSKAILLSGESNVCQKVYYSNRAAARIMLENHRAAYEDGEEAIRLDCEWWKGHFRRARALMMMCDRDLVEVSKALNVAQEKGGGEEVATAKQIWENLAAGKACFQDMVDDVFSIFTTDKLRVWLKRICEPHAQLGNTVTRHVEEALMHKAGLSIAELMQEGLDFGRTVTEEHSRTGSSHYHNWMLENFADQFGGPVSLRIALAVKVADTHCVDTIADPPRCLKQLSAFKALSRALSEHFQIEDALTSGFNDDYGCWKMYGDLPGGQKQQMVRDLMGPDSGVKSRRGVGSKHSKQVLKKDREVFQLPGGGLTMAKVKGQGFPFAHEHPMFKDNDSVQVLCEPGTLHLRSPGERNDKFQQHWADAGLPHGAHGIDGETELEFGLFAPTGNRWHFMKLAGSAGDPNKDSKVSVILCFRLLETVSGQRAQGECNVEIMTVRASQTGVKASIMASKELSPTDDLCLWVPDSPLDCVERSGNEDALEVSFLHPQCKLATQSAEAMKNLCDAEGKFDKSKLKDFAKFMEQNQNEAKNAGLSQPPGGPECPTQ